MSENITHPRESVSVRLAQTEAEIEAAQRLRYQVFYEEYEAQPTQDIRAKKRDFDVYDDHADHLIVIDHKNNNRIVGTYRLLRREHASACGGFYSGTEYDLSALVDSKSSLLELGRSCILPNYRAGPVLQLLWQGIAHYIMDHDINLMFGCASFHNTQVEELAEPLSYMYHYHIAPKEIRPRALPERYVDMNLIPIDDLEPKKIFASLPPLIKGYLRVGSMVGDGAVIDPVFNTTDVCIVAQTNMVTDRYRKHYEKKTQRSFPAGERPSMEQDAEAVYSRDG